MSLSAVPVKAVNRWGMARQRKIMTSE